MSDLANVSIIGNERLLNQAFQNLITNAIKYSEQGVQLILHSHMIPIKFILISLMMVKA